MTHALFLCDGARPPLRLRGSEWGTPFTITSRGDDADCYLDLENLSHALLGDVTGRAADLIRIAAFAWVADQQVRRGGATDINGAAWHRALALVIPVAEPAFWSRPDVSAALTDLLHFATDDTWDFAFTPRSPDQSAIVLNMDRPAFLGRPDSVLLMSGGMDSLCAAVAAVTEDGRRPVLLSHASNEATEGRQDLLVKKLRTAMTGTHDYPHVLLRMVRRRAGDAPESTQRSRPFLFGALGMAVAAEVGAQTVLLPDNGYVSINPPILDELLGALASRSTHPKVLRDLNALGALVFAHPPHVENPLMANRRAESLAVLVRHGLSDLVTHTISCGRTRSRPKGKLHCGTCSQCVDRRFAMIVAGLEADDLPSGYGRDIFLDALPVGSDRKVAVGYCQFAREVNHLTPEEVYDEYPQLWDGIPFDDRDAARAARAIPHLLARHSTEVMSVVTRYIAEHATAIACDDLPPTCLVRLVAGPGGGSAPAGSGQTIPAPTDEGGAGDNSFSHTPDYRSVRWRGQSFEFTESRARVVQVLHEAYKHGGHTLSHSMIKAQTGIATARLSELFKRHPAWGSLITQGKTRGTLRLDLP